MDRRKFIKKGIQAGVATTLGTSIINGSFASTLFTSNVVALRGTAPDKMYIKGMELMGGIEQFIKKGDMVVVKPDMGTNHLPNEAYTTHPLLVKQIIESCIQAGARQVQVFDHTYDHWTKCYKSSGIERVAKDAYARVVPANDERYFSDLQSSNPKVLKSVKVHNSLIEADVLINVPILKYDAETKISAGIKNLMGCVWNWDYYIQNGLEQCLAEFLYYKKPQLNVVDAYYTSDGKKAMNSQIISTDIVAADAFASNLLGIPALDIEHILTASKLGFGEIDLGKMNISEFNVK